MKFTSTAYCLVASFCLVVSGCGGNFDSDSAVAANNSTNMQRLANLYVAYQMKNNSAGPGNESEFRQFIENFPSVKLDRMGITLDQVDGLFVNERDGEAFKIRYNVQGSLMGSNEPVIFEAVGRGDKRMVGFLNMTQREVDSTEYDALWSGQIKPEPTREQMRR
jgi:hypothetical protein